MCIYAYMCMYIHIYIYIYTHMCAYQVGMTASPPSVVPRSAPAGYRCAIRARVNSSSSTTTTTTTTTDNNDNNDNSDNSSN